MVPEGKQSTAEIKRAIPAGRLYCTQFSAEKPSMDHLLITCPAVRNETTQLIDQLGVNPAPLNAAKAINKLSIVNLKVWISHFMKLWKQYWVIILNSTRVQLPSAPFISIEPPRVNRLVWVNYSFAFS
jgi:hypothetical protein